MFGKTKYLGLKGSMLNHVVGVIAGLDFFLFGYDQGVMGGLLTLESFVKTFPTINTLIDPNDTNVTTLQGITVASYNLGCFAGAIVTMYLGDILGRRRMILLGSAIVVIGAILQTSAFSLGHLIAGRVITGFGNGMNTSTVPTWASETSKSHKRGKMVMIEGAMISGGIMVSYWIDFAFSWLEPSTVSWRFPIAFQIVFALPLLALIMELPESPRWLVLEGKHEEAISVIAALADLEIDHKLVVTEYQEIKDTVDDMKSAKWADLFSMGPERNFHRVALGYLLQVFQQIGGCNLITYYATTIYESYIGLGAVTSRILAAATGTEYFIVSWFAVFAIERFGRRPLMIFGSIGCSGSMAILAGTNYMSQKKLGGQTPGWISVVCLFAFNTFFSVGWLGMTWLYPAEIVPLRIRARANGLSTSANWIFNFMVVMITPVAFSSIGYQTYIIFAVINAFIIPVVYFFYPETAYRSLEEIDDIFLKTEGWFNVVSTAKHEPQRYGKNGELLIEYEAGNKSRHHAKHVENMAGSSDSESGTARPQNVRRDTRPGLMQRMSTFTGSHMHKPVHKAVPVTETQTEK